MTSDALANAIDSSDPISKAGESSTSRAGKGRHVTGVVLTTLAALFLVFDAVGKIMLPPQVTDAFVRLGVPVSLSMTIAIMLLVSTAFYVIPRTAVFGAVLITGFLGGAFAIQMRAGSPTFETTFPMIFAIVVWAGIYLRECRLAQIFPLRR